MLPVGIMARPALSQIGLKDGLARSCSRGLLPRQGPRHRAAWAWSVTRRLLAGPGAAGRDHVVVDNPAPMPVRDLNFLASKARDGTHWQCGRPRGVHLDHESVKHSASENVSGLAHGSESVWSMLKRACKGTFHRISPRHLNHHMREFAGRPNVRQSRTLA